MFMQKRLVIITAISIVHILKRKIKKVFK